MRRRRSFTAKRLLDLTVVLFTAPLWIPLLGVIAVLVRIRLGKPVLFRQERRGLHGRTFRLVKFRTMSEARDAEGRLLPDADRLSSFGRWLRESSFDELPEILNVLGGDMSLVGPRPLLVQYLDLYTTEQARRHEVLPGITGWAQVCGRNAVSWEERLRMDVWYVDQGSVLLDLRILALTCRRVWTRAGIAAEGHATMPEFKGTPGTDGTARRPPNSAPTDLELKPRK